MFIRCLFVFINFEFLLVYNDVYFNFGFGFLKFSLKNVIWFYLEIELRV